MKTPLNFIAAAIAASLSAGLLNPSFVQARSLDTPAGLVAPSVLEDSFAQLTQYVGRRDAQLVQSADWQVFARVFSYYVQVPGQLRQVNAAERAQFTRVADRLNAHLAQSKNLRAAAWKSNLTSTVQSINFWWNYDALSQVNAPEDHAPETGM